MKIALSLFLGLIMQMHSVNLLASPHFQLAGNNVGEIVENEKNCHVLNSLLMSEWAKELYIHGWESKGDGQSGYIIFVAGFKPFPEKEWLALAWKVENNVAKLLPDPSEGVEYFKTLMANKKGSAGPAGPMKKYQKWDMCRLKNMDYLRGKTNFFGSLLNINQGVDNWDAAIKLPYRSLVNYFQEKMQSQRQVSPDQ